MLQRLIIKHSNQFGLKKLQFSILNLKLDTANDDAFRKENQIFLKGEGCNNYSPILTFDQAPFVVPLRKVLTAEGYTQPTAIQAQSWPILLADRDIISVARTGSGKTVGFLLPAFQKILTKQRDAVKARRSPVNVLVLAPTRELCLQIEAEANKYTKSCNLLCTPVYGGASRFMQIKNLKQGPQVVIATPGRCNDLSEAGELNLSHVHYVVLDEADRMFFFFFFLLFFIIIILKCFVLPNYLNLFIHVLFIHVLFIHVFVLPNYIITLFVLFIYVL
jgi:ATP-dependent RNA helicase DDX5/DBP2